MTSLPSPAAAYPEKSQATLALWLAILGICCGPLGLAGLIIGNTEKKAIESGRRDPANAAFIIGIITTALWVLGAIGSGVGFINLPGVVGA